MKYVIIKTTFNYLGLDEGEEPDENVFTELATTKLFSTKEAAKEEVDKFIKTEMAESNNAAKDVGEIVNFEVDTENDAFPDVEVITLKIYFKWEEDDEDVEFTRDSKVEYRIRKVEEN